jgi:eukaryotic-like serine/threonine-protein kinase
MPQPSEREIEVFNTALEVPAAQRAAYLDQACAGDAALRRGVEELLQAGEQAGEFLETSAAAPPGPGGTVRPAPVSAEKPGDRIGRYKLLQQIGEGGCGVVYVAEQEEPVRRRVALKVIKLGMDTKSVIARFDAERQALALMDHPNIAKVLDAGATETGRPYFVMELVKAVPITRYCDENNLNTATRLGLFVQVCQAVQHAHQKGIIHRDIKPSNILVADHDGVPVPKIIDFGIAKATTDQRLTDKTIFTALEQFIGTPAYMSPEQATLSGLDIDTRSDIYSLGVLLYELLTGNTPFEAKRLREAGLDEVRRIIREEEPVRPSTRLRLKSCSSSLATSHYSLSTDLDWIVMKALEKDRARRYETANGFAADIQRHLENEPVVARPPSATYRLQKSFHRNKLAFATAGIVAAALLLGAMVSTWQAVRATKAEKLAKNRLAEVAAERDAKEEARKEAESISAFLTQVFQSPDPERDGRTITVAETLSNAVTKLETALTNQPARRAKLQAALGLTYKALGLYREAIPLQEKVRDYYLAARGPEDTNTLLAMNDLVVSYYHAGRLNEAIQLGEKALALGRKVKGPEDTFTLWAMQTLAHAYDDAGRRDEALKLRQEVLALRRKVSGPEDPDTLDAMNNLAISYSELGRQQEALKLREEVLALTRKVLPPEHPETLYAMNNLALSYDEAGRRDEALKLREQVLPLFRKVSGPEHPDTLKAMANLAISWDKAGRRDEALKLKEEVLALYRKVLPQEHPDTLDAMHNLANSYWELGRQNDALKLMEEVLALRRKVSGPEHPRTLDAMNTLADSYYAVGRLAEALKLREEALTLSRKVNGPENPGMIEMMVNVANSYSEIGRWEEARKLLEEALPLSRKLKGPEHPDTLIAMDNLANSYNKAGRSDEARKLLEEALPLSRKLNGPEHPDTLWVVNTLADSYFSAGRSSEATALLAKADPKNSDASLTLATWQTWSRQDADYEATRCRLVQQAEGTDQAGTAERAAKVYCLRPSTNAALLTKALDLAQRSVKLGKSDPQLPWFQLALGLAEYRNGQNAAAERTLTIAEQTAGEHHDLQGTARLFRAMSLFRQGKPEEARKLFSQAEAQMPPLPKDETKPIVDGNLASRDEIIWWVAYKEAKSLLKEPDRAKP